MSAAGAKALSLSVEIALRGVGLSLVEAPGAATATRGAGSCCRILVGGFKNFGAALCCLDRLIHQSPRVRKGASR